MSKNNFSLFISKLQLFDTAWTLNSMKKLVYLEILFITPDFCFFAVFQKTFFLKDKSYLLWNCSHFILWLHFYFLIV